MADPATPWLNQPHDPTEVKHFAEYKRHPGGDDHPRGSYALLPIPGVGFPTIEPEPTVLDRTETSAPPKPAPSAPAPPEKFVGTRQRVSFVEETVTAASTRGTARPPPSREIWFRFKDDEDKNKKYRCVLRQPVRPDLNDTLDATKSFNLWIAGIEGDHYVLAEEQPESRSEDSPDPSTP